MEVSTVKGARYFVTMIDDYLRYVQVNIIKSKSSVLDVFKRFLSRVENEHTLKVQRLRSDNGGEYTGQYFKAYLELKGIEHEPSASYCPENNGLAERANKTLVEKARIMMYHMDVPVSVSGK